MSVQENITIAIMQPYFFPYAGYYRLLNEADIFVIYDCVQFPRRGWVHRNQFSKKNNAVDWLTLPVKKSPRETLIMNMEFDKSFRYETFLESLDKFKISTVLASKELETFFNFDQLLVDLLEKQLKFVREILGFKTKIFRSSALHIPNEIKAEKRILEIIKLFSATRYLNLAGGINLYNYDTFHHNGIELNFLSTFSGNKMSILERMKFEPILDLKEEISRNSNQ